MAKRGRPAYVDPPVEFKIYLPASLAARVKLECYNSLRQNTRYGAQSAIVAAALQEYFTKRETHNDDSSREVDRNLLAPSSPQPNEAGSTSSLPPGGPTMEPVKSL
jgi:hypothetical protein